MVFAREVRIVEVAFMTVGGDPMERQIRSAVWEDNVPWRNAPPAIGNAKFHDYNGGHTMPFGRGF